MVRLTDRIGKGLRTAPRDAMLSAEGTPETKGRIFGFHRSLDTAGAVTGPTLALLFLHFYPAHYRELFLVAFFPGLIAILLTYVVKEKKVEIKIQTKVRFFSFLQYWKESPAAYKRLLFGLLFFALINSSDLFLILRAKDAGLSDTGVIGIYIFYNLVYAIFSYPIGVLGDRLGLLKMFIIGILLFAIVYAGMALDGSVYWYASLFFIYGVYAACTESIAKALISNVVDPKNIATALGTFNAFQSIATLIASSLAGLIWYTFGTAIFFTCTASLAIVVMIYLISQRRYFQRR